LKPFTALWTFVTLYLCVEKLIPNKAGKFSTQRHGEHGVTQSKLITAPKTQNPHTGKGFVIPINSISLT
jgi:hypothetical protein